VIEMKGEHRRDGAAGSQPAALDPRSEQWTHTGSESGDADRSGIGITCSEDFRDPARSVRSAVFELEREQCRGDAFDLEETGAPGINRHVRPEPGDVPLAAGPSHPFIDIRRGQFRRVSRLSVAREMWLAGVHLELG
jgi:hypothetical protein